MRYLIAAFIFAVYYFDLNLKTSFEECSFK